MRVLVLVLVLLAAGCTSDVPKEYKHPDGRSPTSIIIRAANGECYELYHLGKMSYNNHLRPEVCEREERKRR